MCSFAVGSRRQRPWEWNRPLFPLSVVCLFVSPACSGELAHDAAALARGCVFHGITSLKHIVYSSRRLVSNGSDALHFLSFTFSLILSVLPFCSCRCLFACVVHSLRFDPDTAVPSRRDGQVEAFSACLAAQSTLQEALLAVMRGDGGQVSHPLARSRVRGAFV